MPVSEKMRGLLDQALSAIQQGTQHELPPDTLKTIYKAFDDLGAETAKQAHNVLAVVMAKLALPHVEAAMRAYPDLFQEAVDNADVSLPVIWLANMEKIVRGELKTDDEAFGENTFEAENSEDSFPLKLKAQTALSVLNYAIKVIDRGWPASRSGINIRTKEKIVLRFDADETAAELYALVHDEVTEAMPDDEQRRTDPARYLIFWTWWLSEAVLYAWNYAEQHSTAPIAITFPAA